MNLLSNIVNRILFMTRHHMDAEHSYTSSQHPDKQKEIDFRRITEWLYPNQPATPEEVHKATGVPMSACYRRMSDLKWKNDQSKRKEIMQQTHGRLKGTGRTKLTTLKRPSELVRFVLPPSYRQELENGYER